MNKLFLTIKDIFFYANIGEAKFKDDYPKIVDSLCKDNKRNLGVFSILGGCFFWFLFFLSALDKSIHEFKFYYLAMAVISVVFYIINLKSRSSSIKLVRFMFYGYLLAIYLFAIVIGTVGSPDELSVTFVALLIAAPLIFVDRPQYFTVLILAVYILFMIFAMLFKTQDALEIDIINGTIFALLAIMACVITMDMKLQKFFLAYENQKISEIDMLTELRNRNSFEKSIADYPTSMLESTFFVFLDVNGLHDKNDEFGHAAGDKMLQDIAAAFKRQFGSNSFRIGGDEFVSYGTKMSEEELCKRVNFILSEIAIYNYSASIGYAFGKDEFSMENLMKSAEKSMYNSKKRYYDTTGKLR